MKLSSFDPWTATNEEKRKLYHLHEETIPKEHEEMEAKGITRWTSSPEVQEIEEAFRKLAAWGSIVDSQEAIEDEKNELAGRRILECIETALGAKISVPDWLYKAFRKRLSAVTTNKAKTWSDKKAFGREREKGIHLEKEDITETIGLFLDTWFKFSDKPCARDSYEDFKEELMENPEGKKICKIYGIDKLSSSRLEKIFQSYKKRHSEKPKWKQEILK